MALSSHCICILLYLTLHSTAVKRTTRAQPLPLSGLAEQFFKVAGGGGSTSTIEAGGRGEWWTLKMAKCIQLYFKILTYCINAEINKTYFSRKMQLTSCRLNII